MATPAFSPADYALIRANIRKLRKGSRLVHSHRSDPSTGQFPFDAFNPYADTRFAGVNVKPRPAGYYAGANAACALWESDLRNVVGDQQGWVSLTPDQVRNRRLSFIRTTRSLQILDLTASSLAGMVGNKAVQNRWTQLTSVDDHAATHAPAAALLTQLATWGHRVDGLAWPSRQCGTEKTHPMVYAFFEPPASSSAFVEDSKRTSFLLDSPDGWAEIDRALALSQLKRAASGAAVGARLAPPSPDDEP